MARRGWSGAVVLAEGVSVVSRIRRRFWVTGAVAAALLLAACGSLRGGGAGASTACGRSAHSVHALTWMVSGGAVAKLLAVPGARTAVTTALDSRHTVVIGSRPAAIRSWQVRRARTATSLAGVAAVLRRAGAQRLSAVVYDQESWKFTPRVEQTDPAPYVRRAEAMAHRRGVKLIATPATDLVWSVTRPAPGTVYATFLRLGIAGKVAPFADIYEIQAQGAEAGVQQYRSFVAAVAGEVHAANPQAVLLAGLSTNPTGQRVTPAELEADVAATRRVVAGYWLNVPAGGPYCPTCGVAQPQVGARLLESLYGRGGGGQGGRVSAPLRRDRRCRLG